MGKDALVQTTGIAGASYADAPANDVFNAAANVGRLSSDGSALGAPNYVTKADLAIANNCRRNTAVGSLGAVAIGRGEFAVTGTLSTYFGDASLYQKVIDNSETSYQLVLAADNQAVLIDVPRLKFASGAPAISGKNADVTCDLNFQGLRHPTLGYTMQIQRFHYLP